MDLGELIDLNNDEWIDFDSVLVVKEGKNSTEASTFTRRTHGSVEREGSSESFGLTATTLSPSIPLPNDERFTEYDSTPLPGWIKELREHQWTAAMEIVNHFQSGCDVVWLNAPTGSGKTLIAELVRRLLGANSFYVCSTKSLQDQFVNDYSYSRVLKGRSNYPTLSMPFPEYTAADCTKTGGSEEASCYWCPEISNCPYERAKADCLSANLGVLNTSYLLSEGNYVGKVRGRGLNIIDECDVLEAELMNFVQYEVSENRLRKLRLTAPKKGVRKKTILDWMQDELLPAISGYMKLIPVGSYDVNAIRERQGFASLKQDTERIVNDLTVEIESGNIEEDSASNWVRDNDAGPLVLKPVRVNHYGGLIWGLGEKWLCMSATIISSEEMNESLGVNDLQLKTATVNVPMTFPVEHRPIYVAPVTKMTYSTKADSYPLMAIAISKVMELHPDERILVHTVGYDLSKYLMKALKSPRCIIYTSSNEKEYALSRYRATNGAVLLAASMDRGIDLKDEDCRVVVIAKCPFPSLGDRQVGMRLRGNGGQSWYDVQTVRKIVQMTGRGVRSEDDYCVTYILDGMFMDKIYRKAKHFLPDWWLEAVEVVRAKRFM